MLTHLAVVLAGVCLVAARLPPRTCFHHIIDHDNLRRGQINRPKTENDFYVNGKTLPVISKAIGDVGDSWAGLLPVSDDAREKAKYFFWLWPPADRKVGDDTLTIWLNGGPGCSSLVGMLSENGPFNIKGNAKRETVVERNPHSWTKAGWTIYVEQPEQTGYSTTGPANVHNEQEVAKYFEGFLKNLYKTFAHLKGKRLFVTGESYAGLFVPYITNRLLDSGNSFNVQGVSIVSGVLPNLEIWNDQSAAWKFIETNQDVLKFNKKALNFLGSMADFWEVKDVVDTHLAYPPHYKLIYPPRTVIEHGLGNDGFSLRWEAWVVAERFNPCLNVYDVSVKCPTFENPIPALLNRADFRRAIHVEETRAKWSECSYDSPFLGDDDASVAPMEDDTFRHLVERLPKSLVWIGDRDWVVPGWGTLLGIQNYTWHGKRGFQKEPTAVLLDDKGVKQGVWHTERNLTLLRFHNAGHMIPRSQPQVALKAHKVLLGQAHESSLSAQA